MTVAGSVHSPHRGPAVLAVVLFAVLAAFALTVDVPRAGYGVKSDEATYVGMALSVAYDGDLTYERRDLERFASLYHSGPEGIFLKRGTDPTRLFYGKAFIYPVLAAPFVRAFGLNGMLLFNVLLLLAAVICAYAFLAAQAPPGTAALFTTAFFGAAALPVFGVFLMPDIFNLAFVLVAYFLWSYKEVAPTSRLAARWTDLAAAVLLGIATYSKPLPVAVLVAPLVALAWWRREWIRGFALGTVAVAAAASLFAVNAAVTGEFNYQGGERKTFVGRFPFDRPDATWESFERAAVIDDPGTAAQEVLLSRDLPGRFGRNVKYFLVGRHFGFVPYYFPGALAILVWLFSAKRRDDWRVLTAFGFLLAVVLLLLVLPFTWSGGGGPPGNRYALSAYPVLLFLIPPGASIAPGLGAWIIGALFTAKMLVNPFAAAKFTWELYERGPARWLPVELTMSQDLPIALAQPLRSPVAYDALRMRLSFLDQNAWPPEPAGMWVSGAGRADIILRIQGPISHLSVEAESPIRTTLTVSLGREPVSIAIEPGKVSVFEVPAGTPVPGRYGDSVYLMTARSSDGFVPHLNDPASSDDRNLGAQMRFSAVTVQSVMSQWTLSPRLGQY